MQCTACDAARVKVTVGVISPYSAQVLEIQRKLGKKYDNYENFKVHIGSIDGFQGGEKDIIIISTVRSNKRGIVGFTSSLQRTNVALTRARYCLWILGNEETMSSSDSVWEQLILDAKVRRCFFNVDDDKDLRKVVMDVKKDLDQLGDMLSADSMLFRNARWKLMFSGNFTKSFTKLESVEKKNLVLLFLSKLANGWRPKRVDSVVSGKSSSMFLKQYKIGENYILCSVDIYKEFCYMQALKVWDVLPQKDIPKMIERLDHIFQMYTEEYISRCLEKCVEGGLEVPMTWAASEDIIQFKSLSGDGTAGISHDNDLDELYLEDSKVRDSLLLMKFYSLSCGAISNLLYGCDGESIGLPFELTDQERDVVLFNKSSFILGRSGTGKTTVLMMKLFRNDQLYHVASEGYHEVERDRSVNERGTKEADDGIKEDILRQLFVTVSPKLCYSVREQFYQLKRSVCGGDSSHHSSLIQMDDIDEVTHSSDIPDSFYDLPPNSYPLIITFHKFLMMLDGTLGISYFDRFPAVRKLTNSKAGKSRSVTLETFLRTKEVTYEKFCSSYWPHFNKNLIRKLGSLTVFTEIMSVIKGGLQENGDVGPLGQHEYISLSEKRLSTMSTDKRENVYKIFIDYEKGRVANGDFDKADLVNDLHLRLKDQRYKGDLMDFVFIDEVQDLSMRQILLFKYMCKNVEEGFAFSGDTAQTIAKGINFRFEDIRYLFYKDFLGQDKRNEKRQISSLFQLSHNFRTHVGVLKLAQSIINIIFHFFPFSIDFLKPETSLISGEAPVLLETGSTDALARIFVNTEEVEGNAIAFGAEQVILVRDDFLKKEVCDSVGNKALVLTVLECKGLEFQDVLLYNFFSSSPIEHEWRLIYNYMNENDHLDSSNSSSFPKFDLEKHVILCSELKQLYVAVTRAKQRLWICENSEDYSRPMYDYWKKLSVACEKILDESFIKEMQVESNEGDWKSRGMKLYHESNFEMAMMCFERAGDSYWVKMSEASLYQETACMRQTNSEMARTCLKKAAEIFDAIGKAESAARLFIQIEEYERAGFIYANNLKKPDLEKSGECFCLAKCFRQAAKIYASGGLYSKCLSACQCGKLFEMGLQYMQEWQQSGVLANCSVEINQTFQELLQNGAVHYYEQNDYKKMMKFVESFQSKDSMRNFLKDFNLLTQLLDLEIRWGNFQQAAQIAKQMGDCLLEADLLSKCGLFQEASLLMLWYVFSTLTTSRRGNYGPSYNFKKDDILQKAIANAKNHSHAFYEFACMEVAILSEAKPVEGILEPGLQFVRYWRQHVADGLVKTSSELDKIEQDLLERCACRYYDLNDRKIMMKFVNDFQSVDLMRAFLKTVNCLDELILLEEKEGNFLEAARIAKQIENCLLEADLLSKYGLYQEASLLMLWYVFSNLTSIKGNYGPSFHFNKDEILQKAITTAKNHSPSFYEFACLEADILSQVKAVEDILESALHFVRNWREIVDDKLARTTFELDNIEQDLLTRCAHCYYDLNEYKTMMKFVDDFRSVDLMRSFLKTVNCLDELILLEERGGNFLEAAEIAELKGDVLWKSDLLLKSRDIRESCNLIHWYVFAESSWAHGNGGWPLRSFAQMEDLLNKAKGSAEDHSVDLYLFVCSESNILSNQELSLSEMGQYLYNSTLHRSLRSEILASRRLLDSHMNSLPSSYKWNDEIVFISTKNVEGKFSHNQLSVETLFFVWNYWKDIILELIQYLSSKPGQNVGKYSNLEDYMLNYFGVRKNYHNREIIYAVLNPGAKWVTGTSLLRKKRYPACISLQNFINAALSHLFSELFSVGIEVLVELKLLYTHCRITSLSVFCQSKCLFYMFEVAKFLQMYKFPNRKYIDSKTVQTYLKLSSGDFYDNVLHVDCQKSLSKEMIMLREASIDILKEAIFGPSSEKNVPTTIEHMGRLVTMILGCGKHTYLNDNIIKSFSGNQIWMDLIEGFSYTQVCGFGSDTSPSDLDDMWNEVFSTYCIYAVLKYCICADWRPQHAHISPSCFLYLAERLMVMVACFQGHFFVTKSACVEWLIYEEWNVRSSPMEMPLDMVAVYNLIAFQIEMLLLNKNDTLQWINSHKNSEYYSVMVLRLIVLLCLICVNSGKHFDKLFTLLHRDDIICELPGEFCSALRSGKRYFVEALSDALSRIENPLVIVSLEESFAQCSFSNVIFLNSNKLSGDDLLTEFFSETPLESSITPGHNEGDDLGIMCSLFWEIFDELVYMDEETAGSMQSMSKAIVIKVEVEKISNLLVSSLETSQCEDDGDLTMKANIMVEELNQLSYALDTRNICDETIQTVVKISKGLKLMRPEMEPFLDNLSLQIHQHKTHKTDAH